MSFSAVGALLLLLASAGPAAAQQSGGTTPGKLGLGLVVGSPTGLTLKYRATKANSFDATLGFGFADGMHVHADWLYEMPALHAEKQATLGWYAGIGGRLALHDDDDHHDHGNGNGDHDHDDEIDLGVRVPIGLELRLSSVRRLELFAEIALGLEVVDDTGLFVDGGIGGRWFF